MNILKIFFIKLLKIIKWLFILFVIWLIILLISIYISSLSSYKESDFNIPKDFFDTKFWDKDPYSEKNWFKDLVEFISFLEGKTGDIDIESKCIFDDTIYCKYNKEKITEKEYKKFS